MGLRIHAICTSVDYGAHLARSIDRWVAGLASLVVVTAPRDEATIALTRAHGAALHVTDAFFADGALMNKGRAMQEARALVPREDWQLFIDADVIPPEGWLPILEAEAPKPGTLHGARRVSEDGAPIDDRELAGFFQLFHSSDPRAQAPLERKFRHAGNYDSAFMLRWPAGLRRILPLELEHLGEPGKNWCGVGNDRAMAELRKRRRTKSWRTETVDERW